jgi:FixJ family two-component response regulator
MTDMQPLVLVLDDDASIRTAVRRLLAAQGWAVAPFATLGDLLQDTDPNRPGCALVDVRLPGLNGLEISGVLRNAEYEMPIIFMTGYGDVPTSVRAMKEGAADFLAKPIDERELLSAIERAVAHDLMRRCAQGARLALEERWSRLTQREREVLALVVSGLLNKQVAGRLGTREKTIKVHRRRVMDKMNVGSLAELVRVAHQLGIDGAASAL